MLVLLLPYISVSVKFAWKSIITDIDRSPFLRGSQILGDNFVFIIWETICNEEYKDTIIIGYFEFLTKVYVSSVCL